MPVTSLSSDPGRASKTSLHRKNKSGELDVFEAARYFSNANVDTQTFENRLRQLPARRLSLDMPINIALQETPKENTNKKSHKQPSSPGSKLISTLINSIFNQSASKKKKKQPSKYSNVGPVEARKRRSSMGHFGPVMQNNNHHSKQSDDSCAKTPTKSSYKELLFRRFPFSRPGNSVVSPGLTCQLDHKSRPPIWVDDDDEDDGESDSSSDLFDLPIISNELDLLPAVYGTTHMERIAPVLV